MSSKISINVTGGASSFGNIVQGNHNTVNAGNVTTSVSEMFRRFEADLPAIAKPFERPDAEIARLASELEKLKAQATAAKPNVTEGKGILKTIRENFSWAYPAVKDLLSVAWPAVLAALAA